MVPDLKILIYRNTDEIEKLKKIKADSDKEMMEALQKLKELSESNAALKEELDELKVAAQAVVDTVEIPEDNADEPLSLAVKLQKVPQCFLRYVSKTTQKYVGHVLGLVKSYWPHTPLDPLGEGAKSDCSDDQFDRYHIEISTIVDRIVENLNRASSSQLFCESVM